MIKDNQKVFNRLHVLMDVMITVVSYALAYVIKFYMIDAQSPNVGVLPVRDYFMGRSCTPTGDSREVCLYTVPPPGNILPPVHASGCNPCCGWS